MIYPGLVSITFRELTPAMIVALARQVDIAAIEWRGNVHVPHGNMKQADTVGRMTRDAGLSVAAYGSYYRVGHSEQEGLTFASVLDTARALGAPLIRVWAGKFPSAKADDAYHQNIAQELRRLAELASAQGLTVACEYHGGTLTDTHESAARLIADIQHPAMRTYWQPPVGTNSDTCLAGLRAMLPGLANVHVYHWGAKNSRLPLKDGAEAWRQYLELIRTTGRDHGALLEFVRDSSPASFMQDVQTLKSWLSP